MTKTPGAGQSEDKGPLWTVEPYKDISREEWDGFVSGNPEAGFGHTSANFALAESRGARNESFVVRTSDGHILALMPMFVVDSKELRYIPIRSLVSGMFPAGPLFAVSSSQKQRKTLLADIANHAVGIGKKVGADEIRVSWPTVIGGEPALARLGHLPLRDFGFTETNTVGFLLDVTQPEEQLQKRLNENCRRNIQRAEKAGVEIRRISNRSEWLSCDDLNQITLGPLAHSRRELEVIWDEFIANGLSTPFAAIHGGEIVTMILTIDSAASSYYWIGWNRLAEHAPGASHRAMWEAILTSARAGRKYFELGTKEFLNQKMMTISRFKESFGGSPVYSVGGVRQCRPLKRALLDVATASLQRLRTRK